MKEANWKNVAECVGIRSSFVHLLLSDRIGLRRTINRAFAGSCRDRYNSQRSWILPTFNFVCLSLAFFRVRDINPIGDWRTQFCVQSVLRYNSRGNATNLVLSIISLIGMNKPSSKNVKNK
ncbi:hypothetical protein Y032_0062g3378 [Ancylostoma ceylanicum]|uniref:Uncharacterized protein n=1 Tax=Ancylostoma ceylanicum TaxID=53326 RepID=A0A016U1Z6_9BILA|nr:hypothetical protein Y032_0062g3378 [Ancylostoma ceylanicum]